MENPTPDLQLRQEFNRWAKEGLGEGMENHHLPVVTPTLELMDLQPQDSVLDLGCGTGWLARRIAEIVRDGQVTGVDVSDEMIRRAQAASAGIPNLKFLRGTAEEIPAPAASFNHVISVESAYYWNQPGRGIHEILRVLRPGGSAWILINFYRDNPYCHQWSDHYRTPTHLLSAAEWEAIFTAEGFAEVTHRRIPDLSPTPDVYTGQWFRDADQLRRFKAEGALLVTGSEARADLAWRLVARVSPTRNSSLLLQFVGAGEETGATKHRQPLATDPSPRSVPAPRSGGDRATERWKTPGAPHPYRLALSKPHPG